MPYTKEHKESTRKKILESAFIEFTMKGFGGVTVNAIMNNCGLTRGAFYVHFNSKAVLYSESLRYGAISTNLAKFKPDDISDSKWLALTII